jgi:hypothetical protein
MDSENDETKQLLVGIETDGKPIISSQYLHPEGSSVFDRKFTSLPERWNRVILEPGETEVAALREESLHPQTASVLCRPTYTAPWALWVTGELRYGFTVVSTEQELKGGDRDVAPPELPAQPDNVDGELEQLLARVSARKYVRSIPADVGAAVCDLWEKVLAQTRYSGDQLRGNDGETYYFACGSMTGVTWTPFGETIPRKLIRLSEALRDYVRNAEVGEAGSNSKTEEDSVRAAIKDLRAAL